VCIAFVGSGLNCAMGCCTHITTHQHRHLHVVQDNLAANLVDILVGVPLLAYVADCLVVYVWARCPHIQILSMCVSVVEVIADVQSLRVVSGMQVCVFLPSSDRLNVSLCCRIMNCFCWALHRFVCCCANYKPPPLPFSYAAL